MFHALTIVREQLEKGDFVFVDDLINKRALAFFFVRYIYLPRNTSVDIEVNMGLDLLWTTSVIAHSMDWTASIKECQRAEVRIQEVMYAEDNGALHKFGS